MNSSGYLYSTADAEAGDAPVRRDELRETSAGADRPGQLGHDRGSPRGDRVTRVELTAS